MNPNDSKPDPSRPGDSTPNDTVEGIEELAALYAAGALTIETREAVDARLATGDIALQRAIAGFDSAALSLFEAVPEKTPPPHVREKLLSLIDQESNDAPTANPQVWKHWQSEVMDSPLLIRRSDDQAWEPTGIDGIETRPLFVDRERNQTTMLVRMAGGTAYPRHLHAGPEECYVLEGDLHVGEEVLYAGDYQRAAPGSHHPVQSTEKGCLLLLVSSLSDELE